MLKTKKQIKDWLDQYSIYNYTINKDLTVDVDGDVNLSYENLTEIPVQFGIVGGYFYCYNNQLTSLQGCPKEIGGYFVCSNNQLTSLEHCPKEVGGYFDCYYNQLTSLEGCPKKVGGGFYCYNNKLTSLKHCPKEVGGYFDCSYNQLTSLEHCPKEVRGDFYCSNNQLTSLERCPKEVGGYFVCYNNQLTSLEHCPKEVRGWFSCSSNPIEQLPDDFPFEHKLCGDVYKFKGEYWSYFDGIKKKVKRSRRTKDLEIFYLEDCVAVKKGNVYSHGDTLKQAKADLIYKMSERDMSEYEGLTLDSVLTLEEWIVFYRSCTGACSFGTKDFVDNRLTVKKKKYSAREIIELTNGEYGNEKVAEFFN